MRRLPDTAQVVFYTRQRCDLRLSEIFIDRLGFTDPTYRHEVGSGRLADVLGLRL